MVSRLTIKIPYELTPEKFVKFYDQTVQEMNNSSSHYPSDTLAMLRGMLPQLAKAIFEDDFYQAVMSIRTGQNQQTAPITIRKK
jgi:hypothetical protein